MIRATVLAAAAVLTTAAIPATAATYSYTQGAWETVLGTSVPGVLSFVIVGADTDGDGNITYARAGEPDEVTSFSLSWSGNAIVPAYNFPDLANLVTLNMPVSGDLTAANSIVFSIGTTSITVGGGGIGGSACDGTQLCGIIADQVGTLVTKAAPSVTPGGAVDEVPAPASLALLGIAMAGLAGTRGRNRA